MIVDILCANYVQFKTFLDVLSWKLDRRYSVMWWTKRWKNNQQQEEIFQVLQLWRCKMADKRGQAYFLVLWENRTPVPKIQLLKMRSKHCNNAAVPPSISARPWSGPVLGQWDCVNWSLLCEFVWKCKSIGLPIHPLGVSEILCPLVTWHCQASLHPAVLTLLNKSWTKLSGDSQRRLRTAEPLFDERELEFRATDKSDNPTLGASLRLSSLRWGLYPFDWRCRTLSRLFANLGSPCLNISRLIWRGSCNVI